MINNLLKTSIDYRNDITANIQSSFKNIDIHLINQKWNAFNFQKVSQKPKLIAVDGSVNQINLMIGKIVALSSDVIYSDDKTTKNLLSLNDIEFTPANQEEYNQIFNKQMNVMELKSILESIHKNNVDYILLDGDLRSTINHTARGVNTSIRNNTNIKKLTQNIRENFYNRTFKLPTISDIKQDIENIENQAHHDLIMYYLMIEQLCLIYHILNEASDKLICISKTSYTHSLFNENISDMALIDTQCSGPGYSYSYKFLDNRFRIHSSFEPKYGQYPVYNDFLSRQQFTNKFIKLSDMASPLKVQLAYDACDENFIKIGDMLNSISLTSTGYPIILKRVHDNVKITNKNMKLIMRNLGLNNYKKERDVL